MNILTIDVGNTNVAICLFVKKKPIFFVKIRNSDIKIDKMHTEYYLEIISHMQRKKNFAPTGTHLLFIAKNIERVADYVTDVAEQIYFLVNGHVLSDHRPKADKTSLKIPN